MEGQGLMKRFCLLLLSLLFVAVFAACGDNADAHAEETPTPTLIDTPAPTPTPTPEPQAEPVEQEIEEHVDAASIEGSNWTMEVAGGWVSLAMFGEYLVFAPCDFGSHMTIEVHDLMGMSLDELAEDLIITYDAMLDDFNLVANNFLEIGGKDAIMIAFEAPSLGVYAIYQFVVEEGGIGYVVTFHRKSEENFIGEVMDMLDTFTVNE